MQTACFFRSRHRFLVSLVAIAAAGLTACGQVERDPAATPAPSTNPNPNPLPQVKSALCPSAPIDDALAVALWTTEGNDLVFVRHDGTRFVAHTFAASDAIGSPTLQAVGSRILAQKENAQAPYDELVLFDRRGTELDSIVLPDAIDTAYLGSDGSVVTGRASGTTFSTLRWESGALVPVAQGWEPIGPEHDGFIPVRGGWESDAAHAFWSDGQPIEAFSTAEPVYLIGDAMVALDATESALEVHRPSGTSTLSFAEYASELGSTRYIGTPRSEGWITVVGSNENTDLPSARNTVIANVLTNEVRYVVGPADAGNTLAMYCDSTRRGQPTSDGSLLFSKVDDSGLVIERFPADGGPPEQLGKPLTQIALLTVTERSGGYVVLGSDGHDSYCGSAWPVPSAPGALAGNSVVAGRVAPAGSPARQLEFTSTWAQLPIDVTGSCVLAPHKADLGSDTPGYSITDLTTGSTVEIAAGSYGVNWVE